MSEKDQARLEELRAERAKLYEENKSDFDFVNLIGSKATLNTGRILLVCLVALAVLIGSLWGVYAVRATAEDKIAENNHRIVLLRQVIDGPTTSAPAVVEEPEEEEPEEGEEAEETETEEGEEAEIEEGEAEVTEVADEPEEGEIEEADEPEEGEIEEGEEEPEEAVVEEPEEEPLPDLTPDEARAEIDALNAENRELKSRAELNPMWMWLPVGIPVLAAAAYVIVVLHRHEKYTEYHKQLVSDMSDVSMKLFEYDTEIEKLENQSAEDEE